MDYITAGESHGPSLIAVVSGVPAGVTISTTTINADLARRQSGYGRGGRMAIETDTVTIKSGVRFGKTLGSPLALEIENKDWENWKERMAAEGAPPADLTLEHSPRPGHADLVGALKTDTTDCRNILERASARETAARVAAGAVAKAVLAQLGVEISSYVTRIGSVELPQKEIERKSAVFSKERIESSPVRCPHEETSLAMVAAIENACEAGTSLGGWFTVAATGLVPGIGGYAEPSKRLTSSIGAAILSIPAIKGVEFGLGFASGTLQGNEVHDAIICSDDATGKIQPVRATNFAGGLEGGMTTGETLIAHAVMKPIPTMTSPLGTVNLITHKPVAASKERSDVCAVPAAAVVAEAELALVLADAYLDKFGHDTMSDIIAAFEHYVARVTK
ncbi:MAG: chorismate synthase [Coriobacteriia bacterium]|nr:chorismate synthase [Coriobacteriia bacterium]